MDYEDLKAEIDNDPAKLGYAELVKLGSDQGIADILNALTSTAINKGVMLSKDFFYDFGFVLTAVATLQDEAVKELFKWSISIADKAGKVNLAAPEINGDLTANPPVVGFRQQAVAVGICTDEQWQAAATRPASRAEILFGAGVVVSSDDVSKAHGNFGVSKSGEAE